MKFCIANTTFWQGHGFDTTKWRKSINETKAIVHIEYAKVLIPDIEMNGNVTIYNAPSVELDAILDSPEWTVSA
jgi:hypothetical protein